MRSDATSTGEVFIRPALAIVRVDLLATSTGTEVLLHFLPHTACLMKDIQPVLRFCRLLVDEVLNHSPEIRRRAKSISCPVVCLQYRARLWGIARFSKLRRKRGTRLSFSDRGCLGLNSTATLRSVSDTQTGGPCSNGCPDSHSHI